MARPKSDFPDPAAIMAQADDKGCLHLKVTPGARTEGLTIAADEIVVKVRAKAHDGEANAAVLALLSKALKLPKTRLTLVRGAAARIKVVQITA